MPHRMFIFILCLAVVVGCQSPDKPLLLPEGSDVSLTVKVPGKLTTNVSDTFRLNLASGTLVNGHADQLTVDVVVTVLDPAKKVIATFDNPARGLEFFFFETKTDGVFAVVISPFEQQEGDYELTLTGVEAIAPTSEGRIDQLMKLAMGGQEEAPGASIAVVQDGRIVFSKGYGYANLEYDIKNTPSTVFHIASVSKQFTAFAIAMLAEQGKLSLQDDIRKYLPEMPDFGEVITIDQLVHHTSGLRDQWSLLALAGWRLDDVITRQQVLRLIYKQKELNFKPGDEMVYCNTGYTLMAEIVTKVTGQPFPEWCKANIFDPLGMNSTLFYDDHEKLVKNRAYSYYRDGEGVIKKAVLSYANVGATSLFTTVEDLALWADNFEAIKVGNEKVMAIMDQRYVLNSGDTTGYGFGQGIGKYKGLVNKTHGGGDAGYRTFINRFPEQKFSVIVFSNLASFNPGDMAFRIADIYLADLLKEVPQNESEARQTARQDEPTPDLSKVVLADFVGTFYSPELETRYVLEVANDTIMAHHQRHDDIKFTPEDTNKFSTSAWWTGNVVFTRDGKGKVDGFLVDAGRVRNLKFLKE